ncbi:DNA ligase 4 [Elsinoe australis]|uniref:DNA ligase n=1 Tax=Elsinoe australis TaxID=40998 RepID=A0A2P7ZUN5_9PEZI|nr:DNA ligase 4 [Elsinoe australis]
MSADEGDDSTMVDMDHDHHDAHMSDGDDDEAKKFPNKPSNHSITLPFHDLIVSLFNPLQENRSKPKGPIVNRKKTGPHTQSTSPHELRRNIIERFISKWKSHVGDNIYPAFRLIMPDKDRDRAMYGLKEKTIGKLLVRVMKIDKNSEDGFNLLNWKLPGTKASMAGDFAGRCYEVLKKRPVKTTYGKLTVDEVNTMLDQLSAAQKEENQLPILEQFYQQMCPEELLWLIRMILRQMKIGATEKTILDVWHPDAEDLFNVSSSLRRVCWELYNPDIRLSDEQSGLSLMQCFQPQLAAFQMHSMEKMVQRMNLSEDDPIFWIEEKLDGERMQLHMVEDPAKPGGRRFGFWSRKAKDYAYLYGDSFEDPNGALTRYLKGAFHPGVRNIILDGEMITWDPVEKKEVPFGHLKTAALNEQKNPFANGTRPCLIVFDCLFLNDKALTNYTLRDRYKALQKSLKNVDRRIEVHTHTEARTAAEIEPILRECVADRTEGLVLKNPRSSYKLNERNDDWMKVKPEYMTEFGEALDCVVVGGYYGSGHRGGRLSSFLCGLKVRQNDIDNGADPIKCYSFFKVGGGMTADDYREIRHLTDGKWKDWDAKKPPTDLIVLGGGSRQFEKPDVYIRADESIVLEVKAASVHTTEQFGTGYTLRFPRFKRIRKDKDWTSALSVDEFQQLKARAEEVKEEKRFQVDDARRKKRSAKRTKRETVVAGQDESIHAFAGPQTKLFDSKSFSVLSEQLKPKKSKADLEQLIKINGGKIVQTDRDENTIIISDRNVVKAAAIKKAGRRVVVRPKWLYDCIRQAEVDVGLAPYLLPLEPSDVLFGPEDQLRKLENNVDEFGDSYTKDVTTEDLLALLDKIDDVEVDSETEAEIRQALRTA